MNEKWNGTGVALVTPFRADHSPDVDALRRLVRHVTDGGVDYLVVLGTTAEAVTLNQEEKALVMRTVADENRGKLPLMVGIGGNNTLAVAREMEQADLSGYEAILSVVPYYNRPTQEGMYQHFKLLSARSPLPLILYNVPGRTGSNLQPETAVRLARDCQGIIGIKEASGDMDQIHRLIAGAPQDFKVISGDDFTAVPTILAGGSGVISVLGQALPKEFCEAMRAATNGSGAIAYRGFEALQPLAELLFREGNPTGVKALLNTLGICSTTVRLPLVPASAALKEAIRASLEALSRERV